MSETQPTHREAISALQTRETALFLRLVIGVPFENLAPSHQQQIEEAYQIASAANIPLNTITVIAAGIPIRGSQSPSG